MYLLHDNVVSLIATFTSANLPTYTTINA